MHYPRPLPQLPPPPTSRNTKYRMQPREDSCPPPTPQAMTRPSRLWSQEQAHHVLTNLTQQRIEAITSPIREISVKYRLHNTRTLTPRSEKLLVFLQILGITKEQSGPYKPCFLLGGWGGSGGFVHPVPLPIILSKNTEVSRWISYLHPTHPHSHQGLSKHFMF